MGDNIKMGINHINRIHPAQGTVEWRDLMNITICGVPCKERNFLRSWAAVSFSRTLVSWTYIIC